MIFTIPNSALSEVNRCHGKGRGHPCGVGGASSGVEVKTVDKDGVTHVGEFVELYHGTDRRRANKILKTGFRIRAVRNQTMGGDPESSRNYIWFAKRMGSAKGYAEMHRNPAVVTVRIPLELYDQIRRHGLNTGPESVWSEQEIPAKYIHSITKGAA